MNYNIIIERNDTTDEITITLNMCDYIDMLEERVYCRYL